jgi:uncharacterized protein YndB with AHSA1/START domain
MSSKSSARAIADAGSGTILATVEIAAPPERVFRALTTPDEIVRWWGSDDAYRTTGFTADLQVGGRWHAEGRRADGKLSLMEGEFLEVDFPRKLVQSWKADWHEGPVTTVTYRLEATARGTRLIVRHEGFAGQPEACRKRENGWLRVLGWLERHILPEAGGAASRFFLCRLLPPRPTFAQDMTAEEATVMRDHAAYWADRLHEGTAIVFGPVADPKGGWGLGVIRVADEAAVHALEAGDPAIQSKRGFHYEILPMPGAKF